MPRVDIHQRERKHKIDKRNLQASKLCKEDKDLILKYVRHKRLADDIGLARQNKLLRYLRIIGEVLDKPFKEADKDDIEQLLEDLYDRDVKKGETIKKPSKWTKKDMAMILKSFYRWLEKPELVDWINPPKIELPRLGPEDLLTWDDVEKLGAAAMNYRDEALVKCLWESGCRIGELLTLEIRDVEQRGKGVILHLRESKTVKRKIMLVRSAGILMKYRNTHPKRGDDKSLLWINLQTHEPMSYSAANSTLKRLAERAEVDKPVNPHTFRKSSATYYGRYLSQSELKARYGWRQSSRMLDVYLHPDQEEVNNRILELEGVEKPENPREKFKACWSCGTINSIDAESCVLCNEVLNEEKRYNREKLIKLMDDVLKDRGGMEAISL